MIKVVIKNNRKSDYHCLSELTDEIMDETLKLAKEHLESKCKDVECDIHKSESKGTIILTSNNDKTEFEYSAFCCEDFKSKFTK